MFSTLPKTNFSLSVTFILSSANAFDLDQSNMSSFGKELSLYHTTILLKGTKFKAFAADDKLNVAQIIISVFDRVENIVGKGENAGNQHFLLFPQQHFLLFPQCFKKAFFLG